jgi:CDP-diacylglycerol--glycerol-3-phosphate 3-phosphatidyltransferase
MNREILTVPNLLSLSRVVLLIPFIAVMYSSVPHRELWGFALLMLAGLTDRYDGILARRMRLESEWGRILDPLADKVGAGVVSLVLVLLGYIPAWFLALVVARDLLIVAGGIHAKRLTGEVLPSNMAGKWAMGVVFVTMCAALLRAPSPFMEALLAASVIMLGASFMQYLRRYFQVIRSSREGGHGTV